MRCGVVVAATVALILAAGCSTAGTPPPADRPSRIYDGLSPAPAAEGAVEAWATGGRVRSIRAVSAGEVWVETKRHRIELGDETIRMRSSGLYRVQDDGTMLSAYAPYRPLNVDTDGTAWVRAHFGILHFEAGEWRRFTPDDPGSRAMRDGTTWSVGESERCADELMSRANELYRDDGSSVTHWECEAVPPILFREVIPGPDGVAYLTARTVDWEVSPQVGLGNPVVYRIDDAGFQPFDIPIELAPTLNEPRSIEVAPNGDVWLVSFADIRDRTTALLGRFDGTMWRIFSAVKKFGTTLPVRDFEDRFSIAPDGRVWVAAGRNLAVFDRGRWAKLPVDGGGVTSVSVAPDGSIWAGIRTAIHRFPADWPALSEVEPSKAPGGRTWLVSVVIALGLGTATAAALLLRRRRSTSGAR